MRLFFSLAVIAATSMVGLTGCSESTCKGVYCSCADDETCDFEGCDASTDGCSLNCDPGSTCTGECGPGCYATCSGICTFTVGADSNVVCMPSSTCNVTCTSTCAVAGTATVTCQAGTFGGGYCR